jgi:hypothetical protein
MEIGKKYERDTVTFADLNGAAFKLQTVALRFALSKHEVMEVRSIPIR